MKSEDKPKKKKVLKGMLSAYGKSLVNPVGTAMGLMKGIGKATAGIKEKAKNVGSAIKEVYSSPEERKRIYLKETLNNISKLKGPSSPYRPMPSQAKGTPMRPSVKGETRDNRITNEKVRKGELPRNQLENVPQLRKTMPLKNRPSKMPLKKMPNPRVKSPKPGETKRGYTKYS